MPRQQFIGSRRGAAGAGDRRGHRPRRTCRRLRCRRRRARLRSDARAAAAGASCSSWATPDEHVLLLVLHHIAGDGWSLAPLGRDLTATPTRHAAPAGRRSCAAAGAIRRLHAVAAGRAGRARTTPTAPITRQLAFWRTALDGLPDQIELPTDRPRPGVSSHRGGHVPLRSIPAELHGALAGLARSNQASLFMVVQAALAALLTRLGAGEDIPIGSPIAGRTDHALESLVGFFVNTLVLRTDLSGDPSFRELLARVRATDLAAYAHQDLPFERLVEVLNPARSLSRHPLFQVMLAFETQQAAGGGSIWPACARSRSRSRPAAPSSTCRSASPRPRGRRRPGRHRGRDRIRERPVRRVDASRRWARGWSVCSRPPWPTPTARSGAADPRGRRARHHPAALERHRPRGARAATPAGPVRRAGRPHPRRAGRDLRGAARSATPSSTPAPTSWRITLSASASAPRSWSGFASSARRKC